MTLTRTEALALIKKHGINPKKSLGQNFVVEPNSIRQIVGIAEIEPNDFVLEVGPGLGSLTRSLLEASKHVTVIEIDETNTTTTVTADDFDTTSGIGYSTPTSYA